MAINTKEAQQYSSNFQDLLTFLRDFFDAIVHQPSGLTC